MSDRSGLIDYAMQDCTDILNKTEINFVVLLFYVHWFSPHPCET